MIRHFKDTCITLPFILVPLLQRSKENGTRTIFNKNVYVIWKNLMILSSDLKRFSILVVLVVLVYN